jgi:tetratricopeptide (TPR) repeat protein
MLKICSIFIILFLIFGYSPAYCQSAYKSKAKKTHASSSQANSAQASDPGLVSLINQGEKLFSQKLYAQALEKFNQAGEINPLDGTLLLWFGATYTELDRYDEAIEALNKTLRYAPKTYHHIAYSWLGKAYREKGDQTKALEYYKKVLETSQTSIDYFNLGFIYDLMQDYDQAIPNFGKAAENTSTHDMESNYGSYYLAICYERRGYCYYKKGAQEEAKADAQKIFELFPRFKKVFDNPESILVYFDFEKRKNIANEAINLSKKSESQDNDPEAFVQMEKAFCWMPVYDPVTFDNLNSEIFNSLMRLHPKLKIKPNLPEEARRFFVQADTYSKNKDYNSAIKAYNNLIEVSPWYPEAWYNAALIRAEQKNYNKAIEDIKIYLKLTPNTPDARQVQDKIYEWEALLK